MGFSEKFKFSFYMVCEKRDDVTPLFSENVLGWMDACVHTRYT